MQLLKTEPRQRNKVKAVKAPSMFDLLEDFTPNEYSNDFKLSYS